MKFFKMENSKSPGENRGCHHVLRVKGFHNSLIGKSWWSSSHAQMPTPYLTKEGICVLYTTRDEYGISRIGSVILDDKAERIIYPEEPEPKIEIGKPGDFDCCGVMSSSVIQVGNEIDLYYIGWNTHEIYPYTLSIGIAKSSDYGKTFRKSELNPLLDTQFDGGKFSTTPYVWKENEEFNMLFSKGKPWIIENGIFESSYGLSKACSIDGLKWIPKNDNIPIKEVMNRSYARPTYASIKGENHIFYSERENLEFRNGPGAYRLKIARTDLTRNFKECTIEFEQNAFFLSNLDLMQCYAHPLNVNNRLFLFMNGNNFGKFGFAVVEFVN